MPDDLSDARRQILDGTTSAGDLIEASLAAMNASASVRAFLSATPDVARAAAGAADRAVAAGRDPGKLAGLAVSIKDLFDVAGERTGAASKILADAPTARIDAPAVARLRQAGAALIGRTNMSEFAFSGVGINPHHGTPLNAGTASLDSQVRAPGGSTSGGATSVAAGAAWVALGSDTGGSIRIPAALQGLVGFKSTAALVPIDGAVPLSPTLDTVAAITRSVRDAIVVHEILAGRRVGPTQAPLAALRLAVPRRVVLDALDATVAGAFARSLETLSAAGARIVEIELEALDELASINAGGGFAAAESWAYHRGWLAEREAEYDPRVARRIRRGEAIGTAGYAALVAARRDWIARMKTATRDYDVLLSPTVPMVAPPLAPLLATDDAFFAANALLLRNPSIVNFLDGCALSLPCHREGELPVGLMVWSSGGRDDAVLGAGSAIEAALPGRGPAAPA